MTYDEALAFWYGRINYEVRSARPGDLKLERMRALLQLLGNPHERVRLIHVTGTKGKGSTCAMLAAILQAAGYRVGLFTSPHLEHVEERIQVDGVPISHRELTTRVAEVAAAVHHLEGNRESADRSASPTFFEIGTALGFLHFWYRRCDLAVIEVGLGGRFDSTNVCRPLVSVITNIGFDHMAQLGHTLEEIAYQKAGIIKRRVPVVSGVTQPGPRSVIRRVAAELNAPLIEVDAAASHWIPALPGSHQVANAAVAVAAINQLQAAGLPIADTAIHRGLREVRWPARIELVSQRPAVVLDTAHNVPSVEALLATLREFVPQANHKAVVFAVSADKQYPEMLQLLAGYFDHFHLTRHGNPRGVPPEKLAAVLAEVAPGTPYTLHSSGAEAWHAARSAATETDLVCITGSVFLAGEVRPLLSAAVPAAPPG
jgi:dihydrofolate synthase/folylpolyglutamate synthase